MKNILNYYYYYYYLFT